jgi:hypothetical protein
VNFNVSVFWALGVVVIGAPFVAFMLGYDPGI